MEIDIFEVEDQTICLSFMSTMSASARLIFLLNAIFA